MKKIEVYTSSTCHFCKQLKDFFVEKGIEFTEYDVSDEVKRNELVEKSGQLGVPVTIIDGADMVIGFNKEKLVDLLEIKE